MVKYIVIALMAFSASGVTADIIVPSPVMQQAPLADVTAMMQDAEGYVWYASAEGGIWRDDAYRLEIFRNDRTNPMLLGHSNGVLCLCEAGNGDICFGTRENLYLLRKGDYSIRQLDRNMPKGKVKIVKRTKSGGIMAVSGDSVYTYDKRYKRIGVRHSSLTDSQIEKIRETTYRSFIDHRGRKWEIINSIPYIHFASGSLVSVSDNLVVSARQSKSVTANGITYVGDEDGIAIGNRYVGGLSNIRQMVAAPQGGVYFISAHAALAHCDEHGRVTVLVRGGTSKILCISPDGNIWIGGWQGQIWRYKKRTHSLKLDAAASTTHCDPVEGLLADKNGIIWVMSDKNVKAYSPRHHCYREISVGSPVINMRKFTAIRSDSLWIYVQGDQGTVRLPLSSAHDNGHLQLTAVDIDNVRTYPPAGCNVVEIPSDVTCATLSFSTFEHLFARDITFSYRINKGKWVRLPDGVNTIQLTALSKGTYHIDIRATHMGDWALSMLTVTVHRLPAWWETWWAYFIYISAAVTGVIVIYRWIEKYRESQERIKELQNRIDSLLRQQDSRVEDVPVSIADNDSDKEFLEKVIGFVTQNLSNSDLSVDDLSKEVGISRSGLYRRFSDVTGQKPTEFIRSIRLKHAAEMLHSTDKSVSEIAYMCGFSSPSYFNRRFKEMFGMAPSEYR